DGIVDGDIMNRHQPVIGALGESKHALTVLALCPLSLYPMLLIGDCFGRILPPSYGAVNGEVP
ncbi:MAG TPA: hypothetical protein VFQ62_06860, partial [Methylomirabilota bacterium]|nr:hypothetical protein [Methylomirabilota bacterium]